MFLSTYLILFFCLLLALPRTRRFGLAMLPWLVFGCCYDWMRVLPNYAVAPVDVGGIYEAERHLFGISVGGALLTPCEWFALHTSPLADLLAGVCYLCWVPVPVAFALWLFFSGERGLAVRFSTAFLLVNLVGFCGYYIHPAAPPWYVVAHGFDVVFGTGGSTAGLARFDALVGLPVFRSIYVNNSNVFAAVPSLHAAYLLVSAAYAAVWARRGGRSRRVVAVVMAALCAGIWWTAVYTSHHYVIDVLLGIATAAVAVALFEGFLRTALGRRWMAAYTRAVTPEREKRL